MAFQEFSVKADSNSYMNFSSLSSMMSVPYLSKFDFSHSKQKAMPNNHNTGSSRNHFMKSVDIMNFMPGFRTEQSSRLCDISKTLNPPNNIKKCESYPQFSTMNIFSYLVGGFVGSKSQVGCTSMQGDKFQIWDLVWEKLLEIMGGEEFKGISVKSCQESVSTFTNKNSINEKMNEPVKQSYAEVVKSLPNNFNNKNLLVKNVVKDNVIKLKQKRKQPVIMDDNYKGKLDFGRSEKKMSLQQMNSFSSSRWSNSRRKHFRKGVEKNNKRDKREAARDGLEYFNQELNKNDDDCYKGVVVNNGLNFNKNNLINRSSPNKKSSVKKPDISTTVVEFINTEIDKMGMKHDCDLNSDNFCVLKPDKFDNEVEFSALITPAESNSRHRLGSICSVDSDDSFIIFDRSGSEEFITQLCCDFDLQMDDTDSDSDSYTSSSLSDDDSDSVFVIQTNFNKPYDKKMCYWQSSCDRPSNKNKVKNEMNDDSINNCVKKKVGKTKENLKSICSKLKSINTSVPYTICYDFKTSQKSPDLESRPKQLLKETDYETRCRLTSECSVGSDDSFIIFDSVDDKPSSCTKPNNFVCRFEIEDYDLDSDDSDEDFDEINCAVLTSYAPGHNYDTNSWLEEVNSLWESGFNKKPEKYVEKKSKRVHFPTDGKLITVKKMVTWDYALRAARVGPWEQLARDTMRFQNRIHCVGEVLQSVLDSEHREKVWKERFSDLCNKCS